MFGSQILVFFPSPSCLSQSAVTWEAPPLLSPVRPSHTCDLLPPLLASSLGSPCSLKGPCTVKDAELYRFRSPLKVPLRLEKWLGEHRTCHTSPGT